MAEIFVCGRFTWFSNSRKLHRVALLILVVSCLLLSTCPTGSVLIRVPQVHRDTSPPLIDLIKAAPQRQSQVQEAEPVHLIPLPRKIKPPNIEDPVLQKRLLAPQTTVAPNIIRNVESSSFDVTAPADTNGAVGVDRYVQWVNLQFSVFDKFTGTRVTVPAAGNTIWAGFGDRTNPNDIAARCGTTNNGDPIVIYDALANRWAFTQFSFTKATGQNPQPPYLQCIAVSTSEDVLGTYNRYAFQYDSYNDYPKMAVWPDAYYITFNMFDYSGPGKLLGALACAYDRDNMLAGFDSRDALCFQQNSSVLGLLPSDLDGRRPPPGGSPNYMLNFDSNNTNNLHLFQFHVDFANPNNTTLSGPTTIPIAPFTPLCVGSAKLACVPQPPALHYSPLASLSDRLMYRLAYRNFGDHESLVVNHSVAVANGGGGIRWYEIQNPAGTPTVVQQSTYAPGPEFRWMGSIAMDKAGDIAVGYSVSNGCADATKCVGVPASIAIAGWTPSDTLSTLGSESTVISGGGSQEGTDRWGDYSAMQIDPVDDCTFWYTQEYVPTPPDPESVRLTWSTRIVSFRFLSCGLVTVGLPADIGQGNSIPFSTQFGGYSGRYQQVYSASAFSSAITINAISFFNTQVNSGAFILPSGTWEIALSTTSSSPWQNC